MGSAFQDLLHRARIKLVPMTACNPQGNSIIEAVHKLVGQVLCTLIHIHRPQTMHQAKSTGWPRPCMPRSAHLTKHSIISLLVPLPFATICFRFALLNQYH